ncbi:MAG: hypothetical protein M1598_04500 [Actinobacteria bacterium]|nr:hypothetical protein [Actinomycetota bacterium]
MNLPVVPVANGILPRPDGGVIQGIFVDPLSTRLLGEMEDKVDFVLCPFSMDRGSIYPVGVLVRALESWPQEVYIAGPQNRVRGLFAKLEGRGLVKAGGFRWSGEFVLGQDFEPLDPAELRSRDYPVIVGAGWKPMGGFTEMKSEKDLPITIYGVEFEDGEQVQIRGNVGGLVSPEQAHTIEHAIIRSLQQNALCTPRTLAQSLADEAAELKGSIELGIRLRLPEIFGITSGGACGNPMTNLAQIYLTQEIIEGLQGGKSLPWTLEEARRKTLSRLAEDLRFTTQPGLRVLEGLKKGMLHEDTLPGQPLAKKILKRFATSPWN